MKKENAFAALPDKEIWDLYKRGDGKAFSFIYQSYASSLFAYGMKVLPEKDVVKDCIQDLFVELWLYRGTVGVTDSIKYYLFRSLRRKIGHQLTRSSRFMPAGEDLNHYGTSDSHELHLIADQDLFEQREKLDLLLNTLTRRQREALYLKFFSEMTYEEIASLMSISSQAVYNLVSKALKELKNNVLVKNGILFVLLLLK
jgi:RNA polymerase sigma factor (sigma-70 family)